MSPQARTWFDGELQSINSDILRMGERVLKATRDSIVAVENHDRKLAEQIVEGDEEINALRFSIEEACIANIARQQPAARDLREILSAMNIVVDLERMGDHAAGIAKTVLRVDRTDAVLEIPQALLEIRDHVLGMLTDVMIAYQQDDVQAARRISERDDKVDHGYRQLFTELLEKVPASPEASEYALYLLFAGHNLERTADRVTNIAERIIFADSGKMEELNVKEDDFSGVN